MSEFKANNPLYSIPRPVVHGHSWMPELDMYTIFQFKGLTSHGLPMHWNETDPIARFDGKVIPRADPHSGKSRR